MLDKLTDDIATAWRGLLQWPFYPVVSILMLGLAAGANMTAFGVFYGYLLRPLPYADPGRLALISLQIPGVEDNFTEASPDVYHAIRAAMPAADTALWSYQGPGAAEIDNAPRQVSAAGATPGFFATLGVSPILGRLPSVLSGSPNGPHEAVISEEFWKTVYGGRRDVLGREMTVEGTNDEIVGVLPARFNFVNKIDIWHSYVPPSSGIPGRNVIDFLPVRLPPGVTLQQFDAQLGGVLQTLEAQQPPQYADRMRKQGDKLVAVPLRGGLIGMEQIGDLPAILQGMSLLLLVLAIANAANLALVRNRSKLSEFALRRVLGASRLGLIRVFLLEQVPIFVTAGVLGSVTGWAMLRCLSGFDSSLNSLPFNIATGWPVYAVCWVAAALAVGLVVLAPAAQIGWQSLANRVDQGARQTLSPAARRTQNLLGALQVSLAAMLLIGGAALSLSLRNILTQPLGFADANRIVATVLLPPGHEDIATLRVGVDAVSHLAITDAAAGSLEWSYPLTDKLVELGIFPDRPAAEAEAVNFVPMIGDYLKTLGIPIETGQAFADPGQAGVCPKQLVVSRNLAQASYGADGALGRLLELSGRSYQIVGITPPVLWQPIADGNISGVMFFPAACMETLPAPPPFHGATIIAHIQGGQAAAMVAISQTIAHSIPGAVVTDIQPYSQVIFQSVSFRALIAGLVAGFAGLALLLAALGVYAVNAFIARARLPELGIRAMLGASPRALLFSALADTARLLGVGLGIGTIGGLILVRAMADVLFHVAPVLPAIFILSLLAVGIFALAASWRPAIRAAGMSVKQLLDTP